tara:strand:- start:186 stop:479 length:294 start_codon:yes stop_codon:yes gene_type:complete
MWLFVLMAAVIFFRFQVQQSKKENEALLGIVAALLARNPEELKSYRELVGYSEVFGPDDPTAAAAYGGGRGPMARKVALMKEALRLVDPHSAKSSDS